MNDKADYDRTMKAIIARMKKELREFSEVGSVVDYVLYEMAMNSCSQVGTFPISDEEAYYGTNA